MRSNVLGSGQRFPVYVKSDKNAGICDICCDVCCFTDYCGLVFVSGLYLYFTQRCLLHFCFAPGGVCCWWGSGGGGGGGFCYLRILHLLRIILSMGCKGFISASPMVTGHFGP